MRIVRAGGDRAEAPTRSIARDLPRCAGRPSPGSFLATLSHERASVRDCRLPTQPGTEARVPGRSFIEVSHPLPRSLREGVDEPERGRGRALAAAQYTVTFTVLGVAIPKLAVTWAPPRRTPTTWPVRLSYWLT